MTIIEKMNGERFDLTKYGIPILKVGPVDLVYDSENVKGRPGRNRTMRHYGVRKLQLKLLLNAELIALVASCNIFLFLYEYRFGKPDLFFVLGKYAQFTSRNCKVYCNAPL